MAVLWLRRDSNPHGQFWPSELKSDGSTNFPTEPNISKKHDPLCAATPNALRAVMCVGGLASLDTSNSLPE